MVVDGVVVVNKGVVVVEVVVYERVVMADLRVEGGWMKITW